MLSKFFVWRYLFNKHRASVVRIIAVLSILGVGVGVLAMVVVLSVMNGFDNAIRDRLLSVESHIRLEGIEPSSDLLSKAENALRKTQSRIFPYSNQDVILRTLEGAYSGAEARGVGEHFVQELSSKIQNIELLDQSDAPIKNISEFVLGVREIVVGVDLARSLGIFTGDEVNIIAPESLLLPPGEKPIYERVKVKALIRTDVPQFDAHGVAFAVRGGLPAMANSASLQKGFEVRLHRLEDMQQVLGVVKEFTKTEGLHSAKISNWEEQNPGLFYSLKMEKFSMGLFLTLTILVSCFSIVTVLVLLVTEKKADVGVLRSMGATKKQVRGIFLSIGLLLGMTGIMGGMLGGLGVCYLLDRFPIIKLPNIYYDTSIPVSVDWWVILGIAVIGFVLTLLGTTIPVWRVADMNPVDAIRRLED